MGYLNGILYYTTYDPFSSNAYYPAGYHYNVLDGSNGDLSSTARPDSMQAITIITAPD